MSKSFVQKSVENAKIIRGNPAMVCDGSGNPVQAFPQSHGPLENGSSPARMGYRLPLKQSLLRRRQGPRLRCPLQ